MEIFCDILFWLACAGFTALVVGAVFPRDVGR
jgi:hypothetical protein